MVLTGLPSRQTAPFVVGTKVRGAAGGAGPPVTGWINALASSVQAIEVVNKRENMLSLLR